MLKIFLSIFIATILCSATFYCNAQTTRIDSLKNKITSAKLPVQKLNALLAFCDEWESINPDTLRKFNLLATQSAIELQNKKAILQCDYFLAAYFFQKNRLDTALSTIDNVIVSLKKIASYSDDLLKSYFLRTNILMRTFHYDQVLEQDFEMLPLAEKHNDTVAMVRFNTSIGNVNLRLKKYEEALQWHYRAERMMNTDALRAKCSFVYINIAVVYSDLSDIHDAKENEDSVLSNLQKAIKYSRMGNSLTNLANSLSMYGTVLADYKKNKPAETALKEALETRKKIGDIYYIISDMTALASLYESNNNHPKAIAICLQALDLANKNGKDALSLISVYNTLSDFYKNEKDYKSYSGVLNEIMALHDSVYKNNSAEGISEMETKYNVQKIENTILQQRYSITRGNWIIFTITGTGLLLFIIALMILKNKRQAQRQRIKEILIENETKNQLAVEHAKEEERRRIIADLHDDVGGGLSTIRMVSDLIAKQDEQTIQLNEYALKISGITKDVTERMNTIVWALNTDNDTLQNLSEYIRQYGYTFFENSPIEFKSNLIEDAGNVQLSGLQRKNIFSCVKEGLHNIYKHSGAKNASVYIEFYGNVLTVTIHDDGKGMTRENPFGNGLKNIQKRMKEIKGEAIFNTDNGTSVFLQIFFN